MLLQGFPPITVNGTAKEPITALTVYGHSKQDGTPSPENPVPSVSAGDDGEINVSVSDGGTQSQTLTLSTPSGLPGIPVDSGGNYTDERGQQWVCDVVNCEQNIEHVLETTIVDGNSAVVSIDVTSPNTTRFSVPLTNTGKSSLFLAICSHAEYKIIWLGDITGFYVDNENLIFRFPKSLIGETESSIKGWLSKNPVTVLYQLATPTETNLSGEEIAAYKALHTYTPNTTVSNDA